jgi:hypothetical protein
VKIHQLVSCAKKDLDYLLHQLDVKNVLTTAQLA